MTLTALATVAVCATGLVGASAQSAATEEHLEPLRTFLGGVWVGGYVGESSGGPEIRVTWRSILAGTVVRAERSVPEIPFFGETSFFWDREREAVGFLALNSRGIVSRGTVACEGPRVILHGVSLWPDRVSEFRNTLEVLPDGRLRDTFERLSEGTWVVGHVQEFRRLDDSGP